ncbi:hypothetical protein CVT25_004959 [Psilocybe cyanescens]|uniref:Uncharacterized protein n=1 Tax=Psilocybe cyanescens TaxID=93625 RepID=A0A409XUC8_PSICY|nr:hypothetical protein CVT25_004959 [Psilocybe cyanescens]
MSSFLLEKVQSETKVESPMSHSTANSPALANQLVREMQNRKQETTDETSSNSYLHAQPGRDASLRTILSGKEHTGILMNYILKTKRLSHQVKYQ